MVEALDRSKRRPQERAAAPLSLSHDRMIASD
jgi:hypothetical protein